MLKLIHNIVSVKMFCKTEGNDMLHGFAKNTCERNRVVVSWITLIAFFKEDISELFFSHLGFPRHPVNFET